GDIETNYLDGFQYKSTKPSEANSGGGFVVIDPNEVAVMKLRIIPTSEGYFDVLTNQYIYNYTDHLGNVRLSYSDSNKDGIIQPRQYQSMICNFSPAGNLCYQGWKPGEIVEVNNYYPFGLLHNYTATTQNAYQYKYNGKELQETGQYDYGARFYMPDIGRWGIVDPLAEVMRRYSPYNYAFDNPVNFIDPDGNAPYNPKDFYGKNSAFSDDFDPNTTIYGNGSFGGYKYYEMGFDYNGAGGNGGSSSALMNIMLGLGEGTWTNTGYGFTSNSHIALGYDGSYQSLNTLLDDYINIPEVVLTGNSSGWGNQIQNFFNSYMSNILSKTSFLANTAIGLGATVNIPRTGVFQYNDIWHQTKTRGTSFSWEGRWKNPGAKYWRGQQVKGFQGARSLGTKLTVAGGVFLAADIAMSGQVKPSHMINAAMLGASFSGVGSIVAGAWFVADMGTGAINYLNGNGFRTLSDVIDQSDWGQNITVDMYDGLY
ncbi:RHS repeat-associated core domain-containing protein, partial [Chryseobacterium muglaense]